ncbi:MAG: 2-amino-4-hydroxy-6-hydroxymethyldihydropteridine diphosphokinase [Actinomycetota bacterium]
MLRAVLGLGSNIGDRRGNLAEAVRRLSETDGLDIVKTSSFYESAPVDYKDQPDFLNAAVAIDTTLKPEGLLEALKGIEKAMGRKETVDKGPRNIDIDILLYDIVEVRLPELKVPHPGLKERAFALIPLLEVAPEALLPNGQPVRWLLRQTDISGLKKISSPLRGED